ncbi:acyltransferase family protein [Cronobacter malonaticus]|uniref:acyltransferase family protein n=1 Tax=Cronobacter malonaticus TaxID=413503 RepID=UPI0039BE0AC8
MMITKEATLNSKAIAIVCVMVGHLISSNKTDLPAYLQEFATFSVGVFLFLSGYGLTKSFQKNGLDNFLSKKFLSVYVPFVIATLITSLYRGFYDTNPAYILYTITYLSADLKIDPTMWFIYFISIWYICFYVIFSAFKSNYLRVASLLAVSIALSYFPLKSYSYVLHSMFSLHAFTFPLGVLVALYVNANKKQTLLISAVSAFAFVCVFYGIAQHYAVHAVMVASMLFSVALPSFLSYFNIRNRVFAFLGAYSYEIYLFEGIFRWNNFSQNKITNAALFFITALTLAYSFKLVFRMAQELISRNTKLIAVRLKKSRP